MRRYGHAYVPLDEALSRVVDLSGRPGLEMHVDFTRGMIGGFDVDLFYEFFQGLVNHAMITVHIDGKNAHHQAETVFKAFGRTCAWRWTGSAHGRRDPEHQGHAHRKPVINSSAP